MDKKTPDRDLMLQAPKLLILLCMKDVGYLKNCSQNGRLRKLETIWPGDRLLFTNEVRLASCSIVALLMVSIPGLAHRPCDTILTLSPEALQPLAPSAPALAAPIVKKRFLFSPRATMTGLASWYGAVLDGHRTASGETFDMTQMTACHRTLPFGTMVRVVDTHSGKSVIVRINDRGVLFADRVIDLSRGAAERLGIRSKGTANVRLEVLNKKQAEMEVASTEVPARISAAE